MVLQPSLNMMLLQLPQLLSLFKQNGPNPFIAPFCGTGLDQDALWSILSRVSICSFLFIFVKVFNDTTHFPGWPPQGRGMVAGRPSPRSRRLNKEVITLGCLPSASCSPHRNGDFRLTWTGRDWKTALLSSPPMASCSRSLPICGRARRQLSSVSSSWMSSQALWDRAVASSFLHRNIYGFNFYNLHLSFDIPAFFP